MSFLQAWLRSAFCACGISDKSDAEQRENRRFPKVSTDGNVDKGMNVPQLKVRDNAHEETTNRSPTVHIIVHQHQNDNNGTDERSTQLGNDLNHGNSTVSDSTDNLTLKPNVLQNNPRPSVSSRQSEAESGYVSGYGSRASSLGTITSSRANSQDNIGTTMDTLSVRKTEDGEDQEHTKTDGAEYIVGKNIDDINEALSHTSADTTDDSIGERDELKIILAKLDRLRKNITYEKLKRKRVTLKRFSAAFLTGERGGTISIDLPSGQRISLSIPPGSLKTQNEPQLVYIYVPHHQSRNPNHEKSDEAWITPDVRCGPHGFQFLKPVFLTIPVRSHIDPTSMQLCGYQKKLSEGNKGNGWKAIKEGENGVTVVGGQEVTFLLNHFCHHACTGSSQSCQWMELVAFVDREDTDTCRVIVHLQDLNSEHDTKSCRASQTMEINDKGGSIQVTINGVHRLWNILDKSGREIPFSDTWFDHSDVLAPKATVQFTAKLTDGDEFPPSDGLPSFSANIDVYQDNNHRPRVSLSVADEKSDSQTQRVAASQIEKSTEETFRMDYFPDPPHFTLMSSYSGICIALDTAVIESKGYKAFGAEIGLGVETMTWITKFGTQCPGRLSPTSTLLNLYMKDAWTEVEVFRKLQILSNIFSKIDNHTPKVYVDQEIEERIGHPVCHLPMTQDTQSMQVSGNEDGKVPQVKSQIVSTVTRQKEKKSLGQRLKSKIPFFGESSDSRKSQFDVNANEGKSNAAYLDDNDECSSHQQEDKHDTSVQQRDREIVNGNVLRTDEMYTRSPGTEKEDTRKASEISKDSGISSRHASMALSISSTSTSRPLSIESSSSSSTIRPLSSLSESSIGRHSINSQAGSRGLHPIEETVEDTDRQ